MGYCAPIDRDRNPAWTTRQPEQSCTHKPRTRDVEAGAVSITQREIEWCVEHGMFWHQREHPYDPEVCFYIGQSEIWEDIRSMTHLR